MVLHERRAYLQAIRKRYRQSKREDKGRILDEFCEVCGYNRKYAIRLLTREEMCKRRRPGRRPLYRGKEFLKVLEELWMATDQLCSKRLKQAIPDWLPFWEQEYGPVQPQTRKELLQVSPATIDRLLKARRVRTQRGLGGTTPGRLLKNQIPIKVSHWDVSKPGYVEADTVAHCGNSLEGSFVWSLVFTDIFSGWCECRAVWNKTGIGVRDQLKDIEPRLPFSLRGFHSDNGSEFLNNELLRYFKRRKQPVQFTRGRPYRKNDNPHVEQKNWTHARQLLGYDRIDQPRLVEPVNDLYANEWSLLQNHFIPSTKLISKTRINSRYHKHYDKPKTPYQRLLDSPDTPAASKKRLRSLHKQLNPLKLKKQAQQKLDAIFKHVSVTTNVRQRL